MQPIAERPLLIASNYPRSGYHLAVDCLLKVVPGLTRSENYSQCMSGGKAIVQLDHDHFLNNTIDPEQRYIVQYRHPLLSIASWMEAHNPVPGNIPLIWEPFLADKLAFWTGHVRRWGPQNKMPNRLIVLYEDFVCSPVVWVSKILDHMGIEVDPGIIDREIGSMSIKPRRTVQNTGYIEPRHIQYVGEHAKQEMQWLGITDEGSGVSS